MSKGLKSMAGSMGVGSLLCVWASLGWSWYTSARTFGITDQEWSGAAIGARWAVGIGALCLALWLWFIYSRPNPVEKEGGTNPAAIVGGLGLVLALGVVAVIDGGAAIGVGPMAGGADGGLSLSVPGAQPTIPPVTLPPATLPPVEPAAEGVEAPAPEPNPTDDSDSGQVPDVFASSASTLPRVDGGGGGPAMWRVGVVTASALGAVVLVFGSDLLTDLVARSRKWEQR